MLGRVVAGELCCGDEILYWLHDRIQKPATSLSPVVGQQEQMLKPSNQEASFLGEPI